MSRIYKAGLVNMNNGNKVDIVVQGVVIKEVSSADMPQDIPEIDVEAMLAESNQKARDSARSIIDNAVKEAGELTLMAKTEAERLIAEGKLNIDQERALVLLEAEKRGYDEGFNKGKAEAQNIIDEANLIKSDTIAQRDAEIKHLEPELVKLIIRIVKKLISDAAKINPQVVLHLIRQGLAHSSFTGEISLRVSKDDYDNVIANKDSLQQHIEGGIELSIIKDPTLGTGDCIIETPYGIIDSSLDMQFDEIRESLQYILEGERIFNEAV